MGIVPAKKQARDRHGQGRASSNRQGLDAHGLPLAQHRVMAKRPRDPETPRPREGRPRAVGELLPAVGGMAFRRFGFAQGALLARWREVVGPLYARWSAPESLRFPRGRRDGAVLTIRVEGPFAPQLQHLEAPIIERCNMILGAGQVARIRLVQGQVARPVAEPPPVPVAPRAEPGANLQAIPNDELRTALADLAAALGTRRGPPRVR